MKDQVKIIDLLNEKIEKDEKFFAFEFFPAKDDDSMGPLVSKIQRMNQIHPLFSGITWGTGNSCPERSMALSSALLQVSFSMIFHSFLERKPLYYAESDLWKHENGRSQALSGANQAIWNS